VEVVACAQVYEVGSVAVNLFRDFSYYFASADDPFGLT
jgi:hypothetical protein